MIYSHAKTVETVNVRAFYVDCIVLKEVATVCGIKKELTHHMARHTCGTLLISNKVSLAVTSKILGHTSIRTTEIYAKVTERSIWEDMKLIDAKLKGMEDGNGTKGEGLSGTKVFWRVVQKYTQKKP